ncbi:ghrelin O-acyltransferase [Paramormyrops kingsleyae]|uniref:ghrelin O-acyltransferase n=1 Tax=Paramormyrops kingsleyae TaxID=1676925 RepID=UPI003B97939C
MESLRLVLVQHPQLVYQFISLPFAFLFYMLAKLRGFTLTHRYLYLAVGGCVLASVTMGPYSSIVLVPALSSALLAYALQPQDVHPWMLGIHMCWQTFWHLSIQYSEYWLQESCDGRLLLAVSALMLLTQRATSMSMDLQEGKVLPPLSGGAVLGRACAVLPYLSYSLYFPALLGGPLCSFAQFVHFVEQSASSRPPSPLRDILSKALSVASLEWARRLLRDLLISYSPSLGRLGQVLWVWTLSVALRMRYYSHWALSDCLNNAVGLGFSGYSQHGTPLWDGLSDGEPWMVEPSSRLSQFTRKWNRTTAAWLRRLIFQRYRTTPLALTFAFSAWWHGLHPGQVVGFMVWAAAVQADYRIHNYLRPLVDSRGKKLVYTCLSWVLTQLVIACIMIAVEFRSVVSLLLLCRMHACLFPLIYILTPFLMKRQ